MLKRLDSFSLPKIEVKVLAFWKSNAIFEKSVSRRANGKPFVFYEGPPTANGRPGIHHVLSRAFKDVVLRYRTMRGFSVPRRAGWDTHGLPVEIEVEKELGLRSKRDVERYGIGRFNRACKASVWKYKDEWERLTERIGFWLDLQHPYVTYENSYIESLWWLLSEVWKKKLLYRGHKVVPWCTRCGTALSSHELALGYKNVEEESVYLKFRLKKGQKIGKFTTDDHTYILSWTTTPWTLPGNVALAVGKSIEYVVVRIEGEKFILASACLPALALPCTVLSTITGKSLVGLRYKPIFDVAPLKKEKTAYRVYSADFVTTTDGTGVVHTAVMYGEDDYRLGKEIGLPQFHTVELDGKFVKEVPGLHGMPVKTAESDEKIFKHLRTENVLFKTERYAHDYPFCWRCGTPLLYYARDSWFVKMSALRSRLERENEKINWVPAHLKEGRFGEWLREVKDWAISRERYWGTPLPLWTCGSCGSTHAVGSYRELSEAQGGARNRYLFMRHGESLSNLKHEANTNARDKNKYALTLRGRVEVEKAARALRREKIDLVVASDFRRTRETADIIARSLGIVSVTADKRFREVDTGVFGGCHDSEYHTYFSSLAEKFVKRPPEGETLRELGKRVHEAVAELEKKHRGKTVLIVSHEYPIWMAETVLRGWSEEQSVAEKEARGDDFIETAGWRTVPFLKLPRDENGFADPHRPYVDAVTFPCRKCRGTMRRIPEVVDVWFDSGAMPFAQAHFPFSGEVPSPPARFVFPYPADYVSEAIDQTRGWFYTLLAIAVLLGKEAPFRNVICLGHILDKHGQKMSKSKGNIVDPWAMADRYGADAIRWHLFTVNPPGEPKQFDEADLGKVVRQFILLLYNSFVFYETYADKGGKAVGRGRQASNILDRWVLERLKQTVTEATRAFDQYDIGGAARAVGAFVGDLSRWYIRRSRRRFQKPESKTDLRAASETLREVLETTAKLLAPFLPFFSEALFRSLESPDGAESVHLADWPVVKGKIDTKLIDSMETVRLVASVALAKRAEAGVKIRQPLRELKVRDKTLAKQRELLALVRDEVNVKAVVVDPGLAEDVVLDTAITHELEEEGWLRELTRTIQELRQDAKLEPRSKVELFVQSSDEIHTVVEKNLSTLKREVNASAVRMKRVGKFNAALETTVGKWKVWIAVKR